MHKSFAKAVGSKTGLEKRVTAISQPPKLEVSSIGMLPEIPAWSAGRAGASDFQAESVGWGRFGAVPLSDDEK